MNIKQRQTIVTTTKTAVAVAVAAAAEAFGIDPVLVRKHKLTNTHTFALQLG